MLLGTSWKARHISHSVALLVSWPSSLRPACVSERLVLRMGRRTSGLTPYGVYGSSGTYLTYNVSLVFMSGNTLNAICLTICHVINYGGINNATTPSSTLLSSSLLLNGFCYQTLLTNMKRTVASLLDQQMVAEASQRRVDGFFAVES